MVRVSQDSLDRLDDLVECGLTRSRSEAAAFLIGEGVKARKDLFGKIAEQTRVIRQAKGRLKELLKDEDLPEREGSGRDGDHRGRRADQVIFREDLRMSVRALLGRPAESLLLTLGVALAVGATAAGITLAGTTRAQSEALLASPRYREIVVSTRAQTSTMELPARVRTADRRQADRRRSGECALGDRGRPVRLSGEPDRVPARRVSVSQGAVAVRGRQRQRDDCRGRRHKFGAGIRHPSAIGNHSPKRCGGTRIGASCLAIRHHGNGCGSRDDARVAGWVRRSGDQAHLRQGAGRLRPTAGVGP